LPFGGAKRALYDQIRGLVDSGHHVEAWCPQSVAAGPLALSDLVPEHHVPLTDGRLSRSREWIFRTAGTDVTVLNRLTALEQHCASVAQQITSTGFDVVFAGCCQWLAVPPLATFLNVPTVLYLQEPYRSLYEARPMLPWVAESTWPGSWLRPQRWRHLLGSALRLEPIRQQAAAEFRNATAFDTILVNSRFTRESVRRIYARDAAVCRLGVDTDRFVNSTAAREPFLVSVGWFDAPKNPEFLIRAVAASRTRPLLIWIANGHSAVHVERMRRLASDLHVRWELREHVSDAELIDLYQRGLAFVYAPHLEPFGLAPLEANSCGMPVIGFAEAGVRETVVAEENGVLIDNPQQMAEVIDRFEEDPQSAHSLGQRAARHVRTHWSMGQAILELETHLRSAAQLGKTLAQR
jgi:glycosyltransferase involved in cell wall biosynthesis